MAFSSHPTSTPKKWWFTNVGGPIVLAETESRKRLPGLSSTLLWRGGVGGMVSRRTGTYMADDRMNLRRGGNHEVLELGLRRDGKACSSHSDPHAIGRVALCLCRPQPPIKFLIKSPTIGASRLRGCHTPDQCTAHHLPPHWHWQPTGGGRSPWAIITSRCDNMRLRKSALR